MKSAVQLSPSQNLFYPMTEFYEQAGTPFPEIVRLEGQEVPEPYRGLLVHDRDMTPTLAEAYRETMELRILQKIVREDVFTRKIVLKGADSGRIVVFAAIKIYLDHFDAEGRRLILAGGKPFGTILHEQGIRHFSRPEAFIQVLADDWIRGALSLADASPLYGRRSALWNSTGNALAQVLEILPPS